MSAMTMPYKVREAKEYESLVPGDLINATLVVVSNDAYLQDVKKVGNAPLEKPPAEAAMPPASSGFELLKLGQPVPNGKFVNQDGKPTTLDAFRGSAVSDHLHLHELPDADVLSADGPELRHDSEQIEG